MTWTPPALSSARNTEFKSKAGLPPKIQVDNFPSVRPTSCMQTNQTYLRLYVIIAKNTFRFGSTEIRVCEKKPENILCNLHGLRRIEEWAVWRTRRATLRMETGSSKRFSCIQERRAIR